MFIEILKESFSLFKKNLNLAQIMLIFFIVMSIVMPMFFGVKINLRFIPMGVLFFALFCAFMSGLFFAFKKAIDYEVEPPKKDSEIILPPLFFAEFFQGIGLGIGKFLSAGLLVLALLFLFGVFSDYVLSHYLVLPTELLDADYNELLFNDSKMMAFLNSLSGESLIKISKIAFFLMGLFSLFGILTMLYPISLVKENVQFLKIFVISLKILFKNIVVSVVLFLFFNLAITCAALLSATSGNNIILSIIAILLQCYLNVWYIFALFVYYEKVK